MQRAGCNYATSFWHFLFLSGDQQVHVAFIQHQVENLF